MDGLTYTWVKLKFLRKCRFTFFNPLLHLYIGFVWIIMNKQSFIKVYLHRNCKVECRGRSRPYTYTLIFLNCMDEVICVVNMQCAWRMFNIFGQRVLNKMKPNYLFCIVEGSNFVLYHNRVIVVREEVWKRVQKM